MCFVHVYTGNVKTTLAQTDINKPETYSTVAGKYLSLTENDA